jgi:hypothetical protein
VRTFFSPIFYLCPDCSAIFYCPEAIFFCGKFNSRAPGVQSALFPIQGGFRPQAALQEDQPVPAGFAPCRGNCNAASLRRFELKCLRTYNETSGFLRRAALSQVGKFPVWENSASAPLSGFFPGRLSVDGLLPTAYIPKICQQSIDFSSPEVLQ